MQYAMIVVSVDYSTDWAGLVDKKQRRDLWLIVERDEPKKY